MFSRIVVAMAVVALTLLGCLGSHAEACDSAYVSAVVQPYVAPVVVQQVVPQIQYEYVQPQAVVLQPEVAKVRIRQRAVAVQSYAYAPAVVAAPVAAVEVRRGLGVRRSRVRTRSVQVNAY